MMTMIKAFLVSFTFGLVLIFTAHNYYETNQSLARCGQIVQQIHAKAEYLKSI